MVATDGRTRRRGWLCGYRLAYLAQAVGRGPAQYAGIEIGLPHEDPDKIYLVFVAGMPGRWRKNVLGIPEQTHGFKVELFVPGPWCTHVETLGKHAHAVLKKRQAEEKRQLARRSFPKAPPVG